MTPLHFGVGKWIEKAFRRRIYEIFTTSFDPGNDTRVSACSEAEPSVSTSQPSQGVVSNQQGADGSNDFDCILFCP